MQNWEFLPLMAAGMGLFFCTLHYFGLHCQLLQKAWF